MARKQETRTKGFGRLLGAASALKRMFSRGQEVEEVAPREASRGGNRNAAPQNARATRREADIPLDVLDRAYTPSDTSSKTTFRSNGADHHKDQEFALGVADDRWNDEDRLTNKSGDPRIGTHRRTYEPAEGRAESRE